jgi:threonine dehydrogenase-like Zn-dependent dehydrogenase
MYGLGGLAGQDGGGFLADTVLVPFADAMLVGLPAGLDPIAFASLSDNIPDGWRCVGPYAADLAACAPADRRVLVAGGLSVGLYAVATAVALGAVVDYVDTDPQRLAVAAALGAEVHDRPLPDPSSTPYPVTVSTRSQPESLLAALRLTWPDGVCTDTGIYFEPVPMPLLAMYTRGVRLVTGRAQARAAIPEVLDLLAGVDLRPVVHAVTDWAGAPAAWTEMTGKTVIVR